MGQKFQALISINISLIMFYLLLFFLSEYTVNFSKPPSVALSDASSNSTLLENHETLLILSRPKSCNRTRWRKSKTLKGSESISETPDFIFRVLWAPNRSINLNEICQHESSQLNTFHLFKDTYYWKEVCRSFCPWE